MLDVIDDEQLCERAEHLGAEAEGAAERAARARVPAIADMRGLGSMVAVEFTKPDGTPDAEFTKLVQQRAQRSRACCC